MAGMGGRGGAVAGRVGIVLRSSALASLKLFRSCSVASGSRAASLPRAISRSSRSRATTALSGPWAERKSRRAQERAVREVVVGPGDVVQIPVWKSKFYGAFC